MCVLARTHCLFTPVVFNSPSRSRAHQHKEQRHHASSKGKHKHTTNGIHLREPLTTSQPSSAKPATLPITSSPSSICPPVPTSDSQSLPVFINLCTPSPVNSREQTSVYTVPDTPPEEQLQRTSPESSTTSLQRNIPAPHMTSLQRTSPVAHTTSLQGTSTASNMQRTTFSTTSLRPNLSAPSGHSETHPSTSDSATAGNSVPSSDSINFEEGGPAHSSTRRARHTRRHNGRPSFRLQQPPSRLRFEERNQQESHRVHSTVTPSSSASSSEVGVVQTSVGGVSDLRVGHEGRNAFTPFPSPHPPPPPPTSGPNGLGFVLSSSLFPSTLSPHPFSYGMTTTHLAPIGPTSSHAPPLATTSPVVPRGYGTSGYWSGLAPNLDQGTPFLPSLQAGGRTTEALTSHAPSPAATQTASALPPSPPFRAHPRGPVLFGSSRDSGYSHPYPRPLSPIFHESPDDAMTSLMSEVNPTVMPPPHTSRYASSPSQHGGTLRRRSGLLSSFSNAQTAPSTGSDTAVAQSDGGTQSGTGLRISDRPFDYRLGPRVTVDSPSGSVTGFSHGGEGRNSRTEVDVIIVVDSSDEVSMVQCIGMILYSWECIGCLRLGRKH